MYKVETKEEAKDLDNLANEIVDKRDDIIRLYNNQTNWEVFQQVIFDDFHHILLPLVLLESEKKKKASNQLLGSKNNISSFVRAPTQYKSNNKKSMEIAFRRLVESKPENEIKKALKEYFLDNLPNGVKNSEDMQSMVFIDEKVSEISENNLMENQNRKFSMFTVNDNGETDALSRERKGSMHVTMQKRPVFEVKKSGFGGNQLPKTKVAPKSILGKRTHTKNLD